MHGACSLQMGACFSTPVPSLSVALTPTDAPYDSKEALSAASHANAAAPESRPGAQAAPIDAAAACSPPAAAAPPPWLVDFRSLRLIRDLGVGAFGTVHQAVWNDATVAVKVLSGGLLALEGAQREAVLAALHQVPPATGDTPLAPPCPHAKSAWRCGQAGWR